VQQRRGAGMGGVSEIRRGERSKEKGRDDG
jgi:hypothetical protein